MDAPAPVGRAFIRGTSACNQCLQAPSPGRSGSVAGTGKGRNTH